MNFTFTVQNWKDVESVREIFSAQSGGAHFTMARPSPYTRGGISVSLDGQPTEKQKQNFINRNTTTEQTVTQPVTNEIN